MTFSIVAWDPENQSLGIAVTTCFFGVGALVPHLRSGLGAFATQALANPHLGIKGLDRLAQGASPQEALCSELKSDQGSELRQVHGIDVFGRTWAWTGNKTEEWSGHVKGDNFSIAGNMLVGEQVLTSCSKAMEDNHHHPLEECLLEALMAGEHVGGDKRGKQSAALITATNQPFPYCNLRVDDHPDPLKELKRLLSEFRKSYYQNFLKMIPSETH